MPKVLKAKLGAGVVSDMKDRLEHGIKPVLKFTFDEAKDTLNDAGDIGIRFLDSQLTKLRNAVKSGKGVRFTLTDRQKEDMRSGGFLATLAGPAIAGLAGSVLPSVIKAVKGKGTSGSTAHLKNFQTFGNTQSSSGEGLMLGNGLMLTPVQQGSGILDQMFPGAQAFHDDIIGIVRQGALNQGIKNGKGMGIGNAIPITRKAVGNIIKNLSPVAERIGTKVILDQINNKTLSATPKQGGLTIKYGKAQHEVSGGFLGNLVKGIGSIIPF